MLIHKNYNNKPAFVILLLERVKINKLRFNPQMHVCMEKSVQKT